MKKALALFLSFILLTASSSAQSSFAQIDEAAISIHATFPDTLSYLLTSPYKTDKEKVRSIYSWVAHNISYNMQRFTSTRSNSSDADTTYDTRSADQRTAYSVMKKRVAVCEGYSRLFKTLCDYASIPCVLVNGYARSAADRTNGRFTVNHTWNAVYVDSSWHLVDATWGSGFTYIGSNDFVQQYDDFYFFTPPAQLALTHFPDELQWTLLQQPPAMKEFTHAPFRPMAFLKYDITKYAPSSGLIEASPGDTIQLQLHLAKGLKPNTIFSNPAPEFTLPQFIQSSVTVQPLHDPNATTIQYSYIVQPGIQWLNLSLNNDIVLRYRLKLKPSLTQSSLVRTYN